MNSTSHVNDHYTQGMDAFAKGDFSTCESHFSKILSKMPDHKQALVSRGAARLNDGRLGGAIEDFNRAIELDASYARAFHLRGLAYDQAEDQKAAVDDFNRALEIDADYGAAYYSRASLFTKIGREEDAAADMQMVAQLTRRNVTAFASDNNLIHSEHLRIEDALETELNR